jgi:uncharacterized sulfatase
MPPITRRAFSAALGSSAFAQSSSAARPNILWITCEDTGPHLGCYGDTYADTPNLDRLATRSLRYLHAWSNAPVCAPARTSIISGVYPPSTGSEHMRSAIDMPRSMRMYPQILREAGYYATNNVKEDYNLEKPGKVWDDSSQKADWRNRAPGQPFFSIYNFTISHESQIRTRPHKLVHDPAKVRIPAYHPDTPEVRHDWAQYYDNLTTMDRQAGEVLARLEQDGLTDSTIVFYYGDHGSGMPRNKRWPYNSGCHVPLLVHIPERFRQLAPPDYKAGGTTDRLVSFVDLAPTLLSLIGRRPPEWMQGHAFLGTHRAPEQPYVFGFRGRMDERLDLVRSVRDKRYVYVRHYMPHKIYGQHLAYMFETPTTQVWKRLHDERKLNRAQSAFWETKPVEELYDLSTDRDEVNNLAGSAAHRTTLERMRRAQQKLALRIRDVGFLPEADMHERSKGSTPYETARDDTKYPVKAVIETAELASSRDNAGVPRLLKALSHGDSAVRYWAATGLIIRGGAAVKSSLAPLRTALKDQSPSVRIAAAEALARYGEPADLEPSMDVLLELAPQDKNGVFVSIMALNAIDTLGAKAKPWKARITSLPKTDSRIPGKLNGYVPRLLEHIQQTVES